jgi:hypothetical protein
MTYDIDDSAIELQLKHLRSMRVRRSERFEAIPAIKMIIGEWYVDDNGVQTREITTG